MYELSTSSLPSLDPYSDYVGINISLSNSSSRSFLNVYAPPIHSSPTDDRTDSFSSFHSSLYKSLPSEGTSTAITLSATQEELPTAMEKKYLIGSSPLTSSPSMTLTHPPFYIAPLAVVPLLTSPLLSPLSPFLGTGRCYRTWVLITYQFFFPSLFPRSFAPTSVPLPSTFRKLAGMTLTLTVLLQRNTRLFLLSSAAALFTSLALNAAKSSIPFGRIKRHPKAWWSPEVEGAFSETRKSFAVTHRRDEDCQAYISASRRASSVIAKAKAEVWQTTCTSLSPKSNPKTVHSILCSIAGSSSSSSSSPNFPNCSSPRESASVYTAYLISHFSVSQPKTLRSRARGYLSELRRTPPLPLAQTKLPIPC